MKMGMMRCFIGVTPGCRSGGVLFGFLFCAAVADTEPDIVDADGDGKGFAVIGAAFAGDFVSDLAFAAALGNLLEEGFVVSPVIAVGDGGEITGEDDEDEVTGSGKAAVEVGGANNGLECIGKD
jgi:hypothetical protein